MAKNKRSPWSVVVLFSLLGVFLPASVTQFSMTVTPLAKHLHATTEVVLFGDTLRSSIIVLSMFLSGVVYKKVGLRKTIGLAIACQVIGQIFIPWTENTIVYFLLKMIQGFNALAFPLYLSIIVKSVSEDRKGIATAVFNGSFVAGAGVGAIYTGWVLDHFGWQLAYGGIGAMTFLVGSMAVLFTEESQTYGMKKKNGEVGTRLTEKEWKEYIDVLRNPASILLVIGLIGTNWVGQAVTVDMPLYAKFLGTEPAQIGVLMMLISIATLIGSILSGWISDRFSRKSVNKLISRSMVLLIGYLIAVLAAFLLPLFGRLGTAYLAGIAALMMFGISWATGAFWAIPSEIYEENELVIGTSFCSGASNLLNPVAPFVVGIVLGTKGLWNTGWYSCGMISFISLGAMAVLIWAEQNKGKGGIRKLRYQKIK